MNLETGLPVTLFQLFFFLYLYNEILFHSFGTIQKDFCHQKLQDSLKATSFFQNQVYEIHSIQLQ